MSIINSKGRYCYRITHIQNLPLILKYGIITRHDRSASRHYISIGNPEIIDVRSITKVKIAGYGHIGDYVPFYFTPKSIMLFNIVTGYHHPKVLMRPPSDILVIRCLIEDLVKLPKWFFTNGQANIQDRTVQHFNDLKHLRQIDWISIKNSNFSKSDGDYDRPRRYQAEFLVHKVVPASMIESLNVFDQTSANYVTKILDQNNITLPVAKRPKYFFDQ